MASRSLVIQKKSAADMVFENLKGLIASGQWKVGEKLPSEAALADSFGVNRLTVRNALQRLNAIGVLQTRTGEGSFVSELDFSTLFNDLSEFYSSRSGLEKVSDFRRVIETECLKRVLKRTEPVDLTQAEKDFHLFRDEVARCRTISDPEERAASLRKTVTHSLDMQTAILQAADNELFLWSFSMAKPLVIEHALKNALNRIDELDDKEQNVWINNHWALIEAVRAHDEKALAIMNQIIGSISQYKA